MVKINKSDFNKLVQGTADMCGEYYHEKAVRISGADLIKEHNIYKLNGIDVNPEGWYKARNNNVKGAAVNHLRAIKNIIKNANSISEMEDALAIYVSKYPLRGMAEKWEENNTQAVSQ